MPFIARYFYIIASILLTGYLITLYSGLFNPLMAAFIIALALKPFVDRLENIKIPRLISTLLLVISFICLLFGLIIFFSTLVGKINFNFGSMKVQFNGLAGKVQNILTDFLGVSAEQQTNLFKESFSTFLKNSTTLINNTLSFTTNFLTSLVLFILSLFFILYYRTFFLNFLYITVNPRFHLTLKIILEKIQSAVMHYIFGLFLIIVLVSVLNTIGLMILNIENAFLFGVMAGVLTIIPFIGITIGSFIPMVFVFFTTGSFWYPLGVLLTFMFVQFLEGNFLTPNIVGRQVSLNPFAAIIGLITGGMLLGIMGIIFALPLLAIIKVICDEISDLRPIGYLIGNPSDEANHPFG